MPRRCGQSAPPTSNAPLASGVLQVRVGWPRCPAPPPQVRRQVVQSPPWLVATQQAEPAPLPPLSGEFGASTKVAVPVGAWGGTRAAMRSMSSSGVRCSSSALAPRLSLVGRCAVWHSGTPVCFPLCVSHLGDLGVDFGAPVVNIDKLRGHKEKVIGKLTGGLAAMAKMRKGDHRARLRRFRQHQPRRGGRNHRHRAGEDRCQEGGGLQARHHCCRQPGRAPALHARRPARGGQHRARWPERSAQAHADPGRRDHRPGDGHRLQHAGRAPGRGGNARRPDAGCRPRPRQDLAEDERQALRPHHAQDQDRGRQGHARRHRGHVCTSRGGRHRPAPQTYDLVLQAVGRTPTARRSPPRRPAWP